MAAIRRVLPFLTGPARAALEDLKPALLAKARLVPAQPWQGGRVDLVRYSARQGRELELRGVVGEVVLPDGPEEHGRGPEAPAPPTPLSLASRPSRV